ncbi:hypothetical protein [Mycobacterium sp. 141]|uniref:hypothetical protein n=1 Tax=Mycobacterium sp. 141 TaxID=1120797 RepID=UPI00036DF8AF|nr:hypothetical protein [Mycobacterium sp. 141]
MSTSLDTVLSLSGWITDHELANSVEIVARRGRGGSSHFFFFGSGGSALLAVPIAILAVLGGYLMRNPDKARHLKNRLSSAFGAASSRLDSRNPGAHNGSPPPVRPPQAAGPPGWPPAIESPPPAAGLNARIQHQPAIPDTPSAPTRAAPVTPTPPPAMRFNAPPGWIVPGGNWFPDPQWRPDPSWPPAPAGWQFWVRAQHNAFEPPTQRFSAGTTYS